MADKIATRQAYGETLVKLGATNENLVVLDADLSGSTKTAMFQKEHPDRFFNMGISEQDLYGTAAGLAAGGKVVCASTFAMFASGRAFEIIRNSIGYPHLNVKICATHAGITVGPDGASHQTFEDLALMRTIPGMTVINPSDAVSAAKLLEQAVAMDGPCYLRFGRAAVPVTYKESDALTIGKGNYLRSGKDVTLIATGIMVNEAMEAAKILADRGIDAGIVDIHTIKPLDEDMILQVAAETGALVTCEEHSIIGGLGEAVASVTARNNPVKMAMVGQMDTFGESGSPAELMKKYGMNAEAIVAAAEKLVK